ncbi:MAG: oxyanion-translocating ATPase [Pseudonocardiales bacterium]|nr:oxyanion-translocating ATPase [Pseudonocardiales bacterium]
MRSGSARAGQRAPSYARGMPPVPAVPRLHVVTGKGGTGKTTAAAALAIALASGGKRTLLVEVEGRQGIAQLFDTAPMPYEERQMAIAPGGGEVLALAVDPEAAMLDYLDMFYNLGRAGRLLRRMGAIDFVTTIAPGLRDVLLTGKVKEAVTRTKDGRLAYDAVVLDAPPTGRIIGFLDATREVADLTKHGPIHKHSEGVSQLLHGDATVVHLVTLLEEMPVQETIDAAGHLRDGGYHLGSVLVNRAQPRLLDESAATDGALDRAVAAGLAGSGIDPALSGPLAQGLRLHLTRAAVQDANAAQLVGLERPIIALPEQPGRIDLAALFELARALRTGLAEAQL